MSNSKRERERDSDSFETPDSDSFETPERPAKMRRMPQSPHRHDRADVSSGQRAPAAPVPQVPVGGFAMDLAAALGDAGNEEMDQLDPPSVKRRCVLGEPLFPSALGKSSPSPSSSDSDDESYKGYRV